VWYQGAFNAYLLPDTAKGQLFGFWACCCEALFSYVGVEVAGIAADETERQRETLPRAVWRISNRLIVYYVGATFVLGLNVSAHDPILVAYLNPLQIKPPSFFRSGKTGAFPSSSCTSERLLCPQSQPR
jgi:amino acid permease